jgi:hypothetical protein
VKVKPLKTREDTNLKQFHIITDQYGFAQKVVSEGALQNRER